MSDKERGIYRKFVVTRSDGSSGPGKKHEHCAYFVLDLEHDEYAMIALKAYATACRATHPDLAHDLRTTIDAQRERDAARCNHAYPVDTQGCPWTTGGDENGVGAVRCGRPTTHRCDNAPDTCERHKSSCCVLKDAGRQPDKHGCNCREVSCPHSLGLAFTQGASDALHGFMFDAAPEAGKLK